ncbi:MAG: DUF1570 domain-containing protein [Solibacteraceae bacterium]|nr:DUF1570 domain-containing protein [Solibacteraceae bacterium]
MNPVWRALLCFLTAAPLWPAGWGLLESGRLRLYTNATEADARRALAGLDEVARGMDVLWGPLPDAAPPLRVYLFRDLPGLRAMGARGFSRGFFQSGPDYDSIAAVAGEPDSVRAVRHEYIHRVLHRTSRRIPQWLEEGLAELYSTLAWDNGRWLAGRPVEGHLYTLRQQNWMTFAELEKMPQDDSLWLRSGDVMRFYGQSWALTHHLAVDSEHAGRFPALLRRLMEGEPPAAAIEAEYGQPPDALLDLARTRYQRGILRIRRVEGPAPDQASHPRWSPLPEADASVALAELAAATGHRAGDAQWIDRLRTAARNSPRARTRRGDLALREGDKTSAETHFHAAVAASKNPPPLRTAMLIRDRHGATPEVLDLLHRTIALNPAHGEALYMLAVEAQRAGRLGSHHPARTPPPSRQFLFREALRNMPANWMPTPAPRPATRSPPAREEIAMAGSPRTRSAPAATQPGQKSPSPARPSETRRRSGTSVSAATGRLRNRNPTGPAQASPPS